VGRFLLTALVTLAWLLSMEVAPVSAQLPYQAPGGIRAPLQQPAYSPYLNLLRPNIGGFAPVQNYYGLVRPELEFRSGIYGLQQQVSANQQAIATGQSAGQGVLVTGHATQFMSYSRYFMNRGGAGLGTTGQGTTGQAIQQPRQTAGYQGAPSRTR